MASATPDLRLPSQTQDIAAPRLVPTWWQRHICVNNLPKVVTWQRNGRELNSRPVVKASSQKNRIWQVSTYTSRKPLNRFWWQLNLELPPSRMQNLISIRRCGWSGRITQIDTVMFLSSTFLVTSSRAQVAPVDRFWRSVLHMTYFSSRMCHLGILLIYLTI